MALAINVSGTQKYVKQAYVNVSNSWKPVRHIYTNVNGVWKPLYSYSWWTGDWSNCSVTCGGGTQTRSVVCVRNHPGQTGHVGDWMDVADTFCTSSGLSKPITSQSCNTHSCQECGYNVTTNADNYGTCYDTNIVVTTAWWSTRGEGFFAYSSAGIWWNGASIGALDYAATSATINGYYYTRSTHRENCGNINTSIPGSTQYTYYDFYDVCRVPV